MCVGAKYHTSNIQEVLLRKILRMVHIHTNNSNNQRKIDVSVRNTTTIYLHCVCVCFCCVSFCLSPIIRIQFISHKHFHVHRPVFSSFFVALTWIFLSRKAQKKKLKSFCYIFHEFCFTDFFLGLFWDEMGILFTFIGSTTKFCTLFPQLLLNHRINKIKYIFYLGVDLIAFFGSALHVHRSMGVFLRH